MAIDSLAVAPIPAVLKAHEVCELLCISRGTLWFYQRSGVIRPMRVGAKGKGIRFSGDEIRRFILESTEAE